MLRTPPSVSNVIWSAPSSIFQHFKSFNLRHQVLYHSMKSNNRAKSGQEKANQVESIEVKHVSAGGRVPTPPLEASLKAARRTWCTEWNSDTNHIQRERTEPIASEKKQHGNILRSVTLNNCQPECVAHSAQEISEHYFSIFCRFGVLFFLILLKHFSMLGAW